jgi:uncharacterized protein (DUF1501 family)
MFRAGGFRSVDCQTVSRRSLLHIGGLAALHFSLADLLRVQSQAENAAPKARSVILLWLWGGPSHLESFDPKPAAPLEYRGPYAPIATSVPGLALCELFPLLAQRADRFAVIRSMSHEQIDHGIAGTVSLTGSSSGARSLGGQLLPGQLHPTHGSVVSKVDGFHPRVPRFVTIGKKLHQGRQSITGDEAGALGPMHDPFRVHYVAGSGVQIPDLELIDGVTPDGLSHRRKLLEQFDQLARRVEFSPAAQRFDRFYERAISLLTSPDTRSVFDLDQERPTLRNRYGRHHFGQCCLLARRLVEANVRFVQVNWSSHVESAEDGGDWGWDMHDRYFQIFQDRHSWQLDQAMSALLDDLDERGLLSETVVVAVGEFGRTPKINPKAGRDHWPQCYSAVVAGGGLRPGQVIGASDPHAAYPLTQPWRPADLFRTALHQIGVTTTKLTSAGLTPLGDLIEELT